MGTGFKYKQFNYIGGGSWGSTPKERSTTVLKDMATWLVEEANCGWVLDSTRNQTVEDFIEVPFWQPDNFNIWDSSYNGVALFLKNEISKCKLFLCLQHKFSGAEHAIAPRIPQNELEGMLSWSSGYNSYNYINCIGIMSSIIPPASDGSYGEDFGLNFDGDTQFIPSTATRLTSTFIRRYSFSYSSQIEANSSGYAYMYRMFATPYVIGISGDFSSNGSISSLQHAYGGTYFCGRIFGTLAHSENSVSANYGTFSLGSTYQNGGNSDFLYMSDTHAIKSYYLNGDSYENCYSTNLPEAAVWYGGHLYHSCGFFAANGAPIRGIPNVVNCRYWPASFQELNSRMTNIGISGQLRWTPIAAGLVSTELDRYGVVPGDGFKGYFDTNLFRIGYPVVRGKLYDSGNFIGLNDCLLLGWDPENEL